jgi:1-acyl-sn-glycerol-3-phosphate acyltransferase
VFRTSPTAASPARVPVASRHRLSVATELLRRGILRGSLRVGLREVYGDLSSLEELDGEPVLLVANHLCAWDASVAMLVADEVGRDLSLAAAPAVLERWPMLRRVGLFPVERGASLCVAQVLRGLGKELNKTDDGAILFFCHGCHVRTGRLVEPERGVLAVARAAPRARLVPVALCYEVLEGRRPTAWVKALPAIHGETSRVALGELLARATAALSADLRNGSSIYRPLLRGDRHTVLLQNVPCDIRRIDAALSRAGLPLDFESALRLRADRLEELRPQVVAAVASHAGPLYRDLVTYALDQQTGGPTP